MSSGEVHSLNIQSPYSQQGPPPWGLAGPSPIGMTMPPTPPGSDLGHYHAVTSNSRPQDYSTQPTTLPPLEEGPSEFQTRPPIFAHSSFNRTGFDLGYNQIPVEDDFPSKVMDGSEESAMNHLTNSEALGMDQSGFWDNGTPSSNGNYAAPSIADTAPFYTYQVSPKTRQLLEPDNTRDLLPRGSLSESYHQSRQNESYGYTSDGYDLDRTLSQTSRDSVSSYEQSSASNCSSSPREYSNSANANYPLMHQPSAETISSRMPGYYAAKTTMALSNGNTPLRTSSYMDTKNRPLMPQPVNECHRSLSYEQRRESYNNVSGTHSRGTYRQLRPQQ